ncbi:RNA-binding protein, putative [Bodo saltans]|uniref:RNA-binding protein, putative n=1 Tax=Bodo saltans TaxID=75058 RepID=A0A0S4KQV0_BODSA|nr:RNA-binding protein, putative [Bodo saltans]|eukprot:CUI15328.1 RNA-binding protein, putative [Bodo saltans]
MLYQAFSTFGQVLSIELSGSTAAMTFSDSSAAQKAYLEMNGFHLFDSPISVTVGEKSIAPGLTSASLSSSPSALLLCDGADASWTSIVVRRLRGVEQVEAISFKQCLIRLQDSVTGEQALTMLSGLTHPSGRVLSVHYLRAAM